MMEYSRYPQTREVYQHWIDTIISEAEDSLTDWERGFLSDISTQLGFKGTLSEAQAHTLERIYATRTA